jgi:hypothetical protein
VVSIHPAPAVILVRWIPPTRFQTTSAMPFAARPFMDLTALARALQWDLSTLRGHVDAGKLVGRRKGHGKVRTHLVFTIEDFRQFWERLAEPVATPTVLPSPRKRQRAKPRQGGKELMAQRRGKAAGRSVRRRR